MSGSPSAPGRGPAELLLWARDSGLVTDSAEARRLAAMRLDLLVEGALPGGRAGHVALTARWAAFICWLDDRIDRSGMGTVPGEVEKFTAPLRRVLTCAAAPSGPSAAHAAVLARLWERTAEGMPAAWRERFTADYLDFLDATEEEIALRRDGVRLSLEAYVRLRRRTITVQPMLDVLERTGRAALTEETAADSRVRDLRWAAADVAGWANDLVSAADDTAVGQDNLVAIVARESGIPAAAARIRVAALIDKRRDDVRATATALRTASGLPRDEREGLRRYAAIVERLTAATLNWLAASGRFTGAPRGPFAAAPPFTGSARPRERDS
ncbi:hypothetical protein I5Q34_09370 [Streptomyces sp. AV19]|uniref:terpene synthase family protein n=1 Tax=Streptomyces sp. AV19 TaxID=2793068 RepID=UPI0018FE4D07|nr:terpene synthase family protein [Streptomyces sp. AV19]MBH1934493.1 hypothetical protein [Streptomyces sp. AV19]MDG4533287.1 terpene synthase family protein [Streptomyces sp. AV19]